MQNEYGSDPPAWPPRKRSQDPFAAPSPPRPQKRILLPNVPPIFTYILLAIIVLVYVASQIYPVPRAMIVKGQIVQTGEELFVIYGAKINEFIIQDHEFYRLLTAMFLHGGLAHLFFNGYALYAIGQQVERIFGHARFLIIYFCGGLTASVVSLILTPSPSVGASGALFAIFGAEMVLLYRNRDIFGPAGRAQLNNLIMWLGLNLVIGLTSPMIDNWAHIGGFIGGGILAWVIAPKFRMPEIGLAQLQDPSKNDFQLVDDNPPQRWALVPLLWLGALTLVVGWIILQ